MKLKKGDQIEVVSGKDKGKVGKIEKVFVELDKVLVPTINEVKRHIKGRMQGQKSEIITLAKPLSVANVALICPKCKKQTRVGFAMRNDKKVRICRKCEETL